jgi:hypothetical protein
MTVHPFGTGWRFGPEPTGSDLADFDDSGFAEVTLPHTVVPRRTGRRRSPASVDYWQPDGMYRTCGCGWCRRSFWPT